MPGSIKRDLLKIIRAGKDSSDELKPRERILLAALRLFVSQGYFNTNVPDLSRESRCSIGSIYHHFRNKEEVATELYEGGIFAFRVSLEREIDPDADISEIIKTIVLFFLKFTEDNVELSKYLWLSRHTEFMGGQIPHPTRVGFDRLGKLMTHAIKGGIREGKILPLKANVLWSIIFGIPLSYARGWLNGYNKIAPTRVAPSLADACWRALKV